jgi:hypothetical protein
MVVAVVVGGITVVAVVGGAFVVDVVRGGAAAFLGLGPELHPAAISPASEMAKKGIACFVNR